MKEFITVSVLFSDKKEVPLKDAHGRTVEDYEDLGIPIPAELLSNDEDEGEWSESISKVRPSDIAFVTNLHKGSKLYLFSDYTLTIKETSQEIEELVENNKINK
jgi:hypothetical protein